MTQVKAALDALEVDYTEFKRCRALVQKALNATAKNERSLVNKMASLSASLTQLNSSHTSWVSKSDLSEEELATDHVKYNTAWLEKLWSEVDDLQDSVDESLDLLKPSASSNEQKISTLQEQLESLRLDAGSRLDSLVKKTSITAQSLSSAAIKAYEGLLAESKLQLLEDIPSLVKSLCTLDPEGCSKYSTELEEFKRLNQPKILTIQL